MAALGGKIQRGGAGEIARIDRRAPRQQQVDHLEMAGLRGMAEWPGAEPVPRVDRRALIEQFGHKPDAIAVDRRKQRQRDLDRADLGFADLEPAAQFQASVGFRGTRGRGRAQSGDGGRAKKYGMTVQGGLSPMRVYYRKPLPMRMAR